MLDSVTVIREVRGRGRQRPVLAGMTGKVVQDDGYGSLEVEFPKRKGLRRVNRRDFMTEDQLLENGFLMDYITSRQAERFEQTLDEAFIAGSGLCL